MTTSINPRFTHDCDACAFVGHDGPVDVYSHGETVIRRHSDEGADYGSFPMSIARKVPTYAVAVALCDQHEAALEMAV